MASDQTIYDAPQSVEPEEPAAIEGYEPPPTDGGEGFGETSERRLPLRLIGIVGGGLLLLFLVIFFISRFLSGGKPSASTTLNYWGLWETEEVMKPLFEEFQKKHPSVAVVYEMQSPIEFRERLQAAIERGEGPDIFRFHNTWLPMLKDNLAAVPSDVFDSKELKDTYPPVVSYDAVSNNKFYGIPLMLDGLVLYYNKKMFADINATPPVNWVDFEDLAKALKEKDGFGTITRGGAAIGTAENVEHFSDILGLLLYQSGVDFSNLASTQAETALSYYTSFALPPENVWDSKQDNSIVAFAGEKVAMIFGPSWEFFNIKALNPNLEFDMAPVPQIKGGDSVGWATYWMEGVSVKSEHQKEAFELLQFLSSKESLEKIYQNAVASGRTFGPLYPRMDMVSANAQTPFASAVYAQVPSMRSWYLSSRTFDNGINDKTISYFKDAVNTINEGSSARGALETAAKGVAQVMGEYGLSPQ